MIPGRRCPACGSMDTEHLLTLGDREEYDCLSCSNLWTRTGGNAELRNSDPHRQWAETGEDDGV